MSAGFVIRMALALFIASGASIASPSQRAQPTKARRVHILLMVDRSGSMFESKSKSKSKPDCKSASDLAPYDALKCQLTQILDRMFEPPPALEGCTSTSNSQGCGFSIEVWGFYMKRLPMLPEPLGSEQDKKACTSNDHVYLAQAGIDDKDWRLAKHEKNLLERPWEGLEAGKDTNGIIQRVDSLMKRRSKDWHSPLEQALRFGTRRLEMLPSGKTDARVLIMVTDGCPDCLIGAEKGSDEKRRRELGESLEQALKRARAGGNVPITVELLTVARLGNDDLQCQKTTEQGAALADKLRTAMHGACPEVCNCLDDDGDGSSDKAPDGGVLRQSTGAQGVCAHQEQVCQNGMWVDAGSGCELSRAYEMPEETCDGLDNDCDGLVDESPCLPRCKTEASFPDVVAVGRQGRWLCSGILIHPRAVLTARHCLPADSVLVGESIERFQEIRVVRADFPAPIPGADVALLVLDRPLDVPLHPLREAGDYSPPTSVLSHVGFGTDSPSGRVGFGDKRELLLDAEGWGCTPERSLREGCDPRHEMRVGGSPGRDTCSGDSGGALFEFIPARTPCLALSYCQRPEDPRSRGLERRLLGVTSRSIAGGTVRCGQGGIYTRMDVIRPWLNTRLKALDSIPVSPQELNP